MKLIKHGENTFGHQDYGELKKLGLPLSCLKFLYGKFKIKTIKSFIELDINQIHKHYSGIGAGKIALIFEKQRYWSKLVNRSIPSVDSFLDNLEIPHSCKNALYGLNIRTVDAFCKLDIDRLKMVHGIGENKITFLKEMQQKLKKKNNIDKNSSIVFHDKTSLVAYTPVKILDKSVGDVLTFPDGIETIGDIPFSDDLLRLLQYGAFYSFDPESVKKIGKMME